MRVIAIDPGLTSGYAMYSTVTGYFHSSEHDAAALYRRLEMSVWAGDRTGDRPTVIIEKYTITARTAKLSQQTEALRIIGAVEYICATGQAQLRVSPTSRKKFGSNDKLRQLGWFKGGAGHADDAARHLLAYLATVPEGKTIMERLAA